MRLKIVFISTGLQLGGAELVLGRLVEGLLAMDNHCSVVSLTGTGKVGARLETLNVPVFAMNLRRSTLGLTALPRLIRILRSEKPDVIQTWMYHADLLGGLAAHLGYRAPLVWGIRQSTLDPQASPRVTRIVARACSRLSKYVPHQIVCCSHSAYNVHSAMGYDASKLLVVENGFDTELWRYSEEARAEVRRKLGLPVHAFLIGLAARFDPQKDHETFFYAARILSGQYPNTQYVLCGPGIEERNSELMAILRRSEMLTNVHLLGERDDMPWVTAALDIATSSSAYGEGFPNVIGEAMACEVCCVATDVGDAGRIIGSTGWIVPKRDPRALASAWATAIEAGATERRNRGRVARDRISRFYSLDRSTRAYRDIYQELLHRCVV